MQANSVAESFVDGWDFVSTLGEGSFAEVKLAIHRDTQEALAVKLIDVEKAGKNEIMREIHILRLLDHANIVKYYGYRLNNGMCYMFMEYAQGGELFDRIEPDVGMASTSAHHYFSQLLLVIEYLHSMGITHRDIKPENLLLDNTDNLKVTDFGLATVFRHKGRERRLEKICGTEQYLAPEVLSKERFHAEPVDIWAAGIVLVAMLCGELPWDSAIPSCPEYSAWLAKDYVGRSPWSKLDTVALALFIAIFQSNPKKRLGLSEIRKHTWFTKHDSLPFQRSISAPNGAPSTQPIQAQTPDRPLSHSRECNKKHDAAPPVLVCFSQPADFNAMAISQQSLSLSQKSMFLVRRVTRFFTTTSALVTMEKLRNAIERMQLNFKSTTAYQLTINTRDRRSQRLVWKSTLVEVNNKVLVDCRLSHGDGLEFKRHFIKLRQIMLPSIFDDGCLDGLYR